MRSDRNDWLVYLVLRFVGFVCVRLIVKNRPTSLLHLDRAVIQVYDLMTIFILLFVEMFMIRFACCFSSRYGSPWRRGSRGGDVAITSPFFCLSAFLLW